MAGFATKQVKLAPLSPEVTGRPSLIRNTFSIQYFSLIIDQYPIFIVDHICIYRLSQKVRKLLKSVNGIWNLILSKKNTFSEFLKIKFCFDAYRQNHVENDHASRMLRKFASFEDFGGIKCKAWASLTRNYQPL